MPGGVLGLLKLLTHWDTGQPTTPATGATLFVKRRARNMLAWVDNVGHDTTVQPHFGVNRIHMWWPIANTTGIGTNSLPATILSGGGAAGTAVAPSASGTLAGATRVRLSATTTAQTAGTVRGNALVTSTGLGFHLIFRFGFSAAPATGTRFFAGLLATTASTIGIADAPSANIVGVGWDAADAPAFYTYLNGSGGGTALKVAISGVTVTTGEIYELHLFTPPGGTTSVGWYLRAVGGGSFASGSLATSGRIPTGVMTPHLGIGNGALTTAYSTDFVSMTLDSDN